MPYKVGVIQWLSPMQADQTETLTTGTNKFSMRVPGCTVIGLPRAALLGAVSSSGNPTFDINIAGNSILGANKLSIDANESTSVTAATPTTVASPVIPDDSVLSIDIDVAGTGAKGWQVEVPVIFNGP